MSSPLMQSTICKHLAITRITRITRRLELQSHVVSAAMGCQLEQIKPKCSYRHIVCVVMSTKHAGCQILRHSKLKSDG